MEINLDALRKARLAGSRKKPAHTVRFKGETFPIAVETPWDLAFGLATNDSRLILSGLREAFGKKWDAFCSLKPSTDDMASLAVAINDLGGGPGESKASGGSSSSTSRRSRRTSNGSIS